MASTPEDLRMTGKRRRAIRFSLWSFRGSVRCREPGGLCPHGREHERFRTLDIVVKSEG